jgi:serine protease Do
MNRKSEGSIETPLFLRKIKMKFLSVSLLSLLLLGCNNISTVNIAQQGVSGTVLINSQIDLTTGATGTGFFIGDNQILTNHHVVSGRSDIYIYSSNSNRKYAAKIKHTDPVSDIAILELIDWEVFKRNELPKNMEFDNSDSVGVGSKVVVIGHPSGLVWSVSEGIISGENRRIGMNPKFMNQVDANLFQGNSGGPVFGSNGKVVCVSTMMLTIEGGSYGFCIPSNLVKKVLNDFELFGKVRWRVLNITAGLTDDGSSVIVQSLEPDGAAYKAGIKEGDKILEIYTPKNHPGGITVKNMDTLVTELALLNGDDIDVKLMIDRNGSKMLIDVTTNYKLSSDYTAD